MKVQFHLDKKNRPQSEGGVKVAYGQAKRGGYRVRWFLILGLILSPLFVATYYFYRSHVLIISPAILTSVPIVLTAQDPGTVRRLEVQSGDRVARGTLLLENKNDELDSLIAFIETQLANLAETRSEIEARYLQAISESEQNLAKTVEIQKRFEKFREIGSISELDYASITGMVSAENKRLNDLFIELYEARRLIEERSQAGPIAQQRRALEKELISLESRRANLKRAAPFDGRVLEVHVVEGERVQFGQDLITFVNSTQPRIVAYLEPKHLPLAKPGNSVRVVFPDRNEFAATVSEDITLVSKLPTQLASPFAGEPAYLRLSIDIDTDLEQRYWIEGLTVDVHFSREWF